MQAVVLSDRFLQARDMVKETSDYFVQMSETIPTHLRNTWLKQIEKAESCRKKDPSGMDILGADATDPLLQIPASAPVPGAASSQDEEWLLLALSIEERQCVLKIIDLIHIY